MFRYQAEKFRSARAALMLPHHRGTAESIAVAFHECSLALHDLRRDQVSDEALAAIRRLEGFMDVDGVESGSGRGAWATKAETFDMNVVGEVSHTIAELADYFDQRFWTER